MAKKDTIIALRNRGIEEQTAWTLVDAGFTISHLKRAKLTELTKHISKESAISVMEKMGVKADKQEKKTAPAKAKASDAPAKKQTKKKEKAGKAKKDKKKSDGPVIALLWSEKDAQRITAYRRLLIKVANTVLCTKAQLKISRPTLPAEGYIVVPEKGVAYSCIVDSIRTTKETTNPKNTEIVLAGDEKKKFSTFLKLSEFDRFKHPIALDKIITHKGEGVKKVKDFVKIIAPHSMPEPEEVPKKEIVYGPPPLPPKGVKPRVGIIWSVQDDDLVSVYKKTLDEKKVVLWGVTFPVNPKKFKYPLTGYIYIKGEGVRYLAKIDDVEAAAEPFVTTNNKLLPPTLSSSEFPTYFKISSIVPLERLFGLNEFRNTSGDPVRSARNYTQIMDLALAGTALLSAEDHKG